MGPDNYAWLLTLAIASLGSFTATLLSAVVLRPIGEQPTPDRANYFASVLHESLVRQQQVFVVFHISIAAATRFRGQRFTVLVPMVFTLVAVIFLIIGLVAVKGQLAALRRSARAYRGMSAATVVRTFPNTVAMYSFSVLAALGTGICPLAGPFPCLPR
jgi:hypothetical protein